jgi:hypothetical protein
MAVLVKSSMNGSLLNHLFFTSNTVFFCTYRMMEVSRSIFPNSGCVCIWMEVLNTDMFEIPVLACGCNFSPVLVFIYVISYIYFYIQRCIFFTSSIGTTKQLICVFPRDVIFAITDVILQQCSVICF